MLSVCKRYLIKNHPNIRFLNPKYLYSTNTGDSHHVDYDVVVVGGGIVGVATAREFLKRHPKLSMAILEKETKIAVHQSGHNSGVIHAGIYYKPGSLKAKLCVEGMHLTYAYLNEKKIPYKKVGKLIVATNNVQVKQLDELYERGKQNKVPNLQVIDGKQIPEIEPYCRGVKALWSPETGIVDFVVVTRHYAQDFEQFGGSIHLNFEVKDFQMSNDSNYPVVIVAKDGQRIRAKYVLTCGGLYSDKLATLTGCSEDPKIIPFRGEYLLLNPAKAFMIKGNIYPVPDPRFPFLGVHFTPRMDGSVWLGPNAVLAFRREGYTWLDINLSEFKDALFYRGFRKMAAKYFIPGNMEALKSIFTRLQVRDLQKFVPDVKYSDVSRGPAGVRAQALDMKGQLLDDFYFDTGKSELGKRVLHCRNAPSPGATSSLAIAKMIADKLEKEFQIKAS